MRIAFLFASLAAYFIACLRELKEEPDVSLCVVHWPDVNDAPFALSNLEWIDEVLLKETYTYGQILQKVKSFNPQVLFIPGWIDKDYLRIAKALKPHTLVVSGIDTQWNGSLRQRIGTLIAKWYLKPAIDIMWVAGEHQRILAQRLGYGSDQCWGGLYSCDWQKFGVHGHTPLSSRERAFLFVGRYVKEKGIAVLAKAYRAYRAKTNQPWKLICAGTGSYSPEFWNDHPIDHIGFVQPDDLPQLMGRCSAFVLPSMYEPWGLVIHEAAASGLPVICTHACGAAVHLVYDGHNGYVLDPGSVDQLTNAMLKISALTDAEWGQMSAHSHAISQINTPAQWAHKLLSNARELLK